MTDDLRNQIYSTMNLKETDELIEIWRTNNRKEWTDTTFEVVKDILMARGTEIPNQDDPALITNKDFEEEEEEDYVFSEIELKIIDDNNPPDFYDPFDVLELTSWIDKTTKVVPVVVIALNLTKFPSLINTFSSGDSGFFVVFIAFIAMALNALVGIAITNFILKTLSQLLKILMQMEFNSRKNH